MAQNKNKKSLLPQVSKKKPSKSKPSQGARTPSKVPLPSLSSGLSNLVSGVTSGINSTISTISSAVPGLPSFRPPVHQPSLGKPPVSYGQAPVQTQPSTPPPPAPSASLGATSAASVAPIEGAKADGLFGGLLEDIIPSPEDIFGIGGLSKELKDSMSKWIGYGVLLLVIAIVIVVIIKVVKAGAGK